MRRVIEIFYMLLVAVLHISVAYDSTVRRYMQEIDEFIESSKEYTYPTDSREYLKGQNEDIIQECVHAGEYDFIVVGAGSSGSVVASRLSEVRNWRVLLLEAGGHETDVSEIPAMATYLQKSRFNWGYKSVPQNNSLLSFINRTQLVTRGRALGGSSAINYVMYVRGNREDYNLWASLGNPGWAYRDLLPYMKKSEHTHIYKPDPGYHGFHGKLNVENVNILSPLTYAFLLANEELGREILFDFNGRTEKGFSVLQTTTKHGRRWSGAKAFLKPAEHRDNLKILTDSLVVKLLVRNQTVFGVQYINNGTSYCIEATMEVILSTGTINTPQLLMLTGIGPEEHLKEYNINVIQNLPGVGNNLWDHALNMLQPFTTNYTTKDISEEEAIKRYLDGKGELTCTDFNQDVGFANLYSSDKSRPDVEHIFRSSKMPNMSYEFYKQYNGYSEEIYDYIIKPLIGITTWNSYTVLLHPKSRGSVKLKSNSPFDYPLIDLNTFSDPNNDDINTLVEAFKDLERISNTENMQKYNSEMFKIDIPACRSYTFQSDDYYACLVKNLVSSVFHYSGTCKMGPQNDTQAVVDNKLRVYGINNLRIADCSILPVTISGHTNAVAYVIGEKAADMIKDQYGVE